ncbi:MAG: hypothetical protein P8Q53_01380 [Flavobacteriaceae bacterium]|nr:hypothetical protein [Flavobacteriaceae bacterium]
MKNIKYLALLFSLTLLISCGQDDADSVTNPGEYTPTSEVNVGFTDTNIDQMVLENDPTADPLTYTIGTNINPLDVDITLTLGITSSDGSPDGASYPQTVIIPAGESSVDVQLSFSDDGVAEGFAEEIYTFEILDVDFGSSDVYYLTQGELTRNITVIDSEPDFTAPPGAVEISVTWSNAAKDLDVFLVTGDQDLGGVLIDDSQGVTTTEQVVLPADQEGVFSLFMYEWSSDYPVEFNVSFTFPGGLVETFTDVKIQDDSFQFTLIKASLGAQFGYRITQL